MGILPNLEDMAALIKEAQEPLLARLDRVIELLAGCYICRPGDPAAPEEGCSRCEAEYVREVVEFYERCGAEDCWCSRGGPSG